MRAISLGDGEQRRFAGVHVGSQRYFACVLDVDQLQLNYPHTPLREPEIVAWLTALAPAVVAIGAPPGPNNGAVTRRHGEPPVRRLAERRLGIHGCYATPERVEAMVAARAFMAAGVRLYRALGDAWGASADFGGGDGRLVETQPTLAFRALLGDEGNRDDELRLDPERLLPSRHTRAGRRARIALLTRALAELEMDGKRWTEPWARRVDWADATMAALVACWRTRNLEQIVQLGDGSEGVVTLRLADWRDCLRRLPTRFGAALDTAPTAAPADSTPPPSRRSRPVHPGWLLRFEAQKPPTFSVDELAGTLVGECSVQGETWLPLWAKGQALSGVAHAVDSGQCELGISFGSRVRVVVEVVEVHGDGHEELEWHKLTGHRDNPWYAAGAPVTAAPTWLRVRRAREVDLGPEQFETGRKDGGWGQGFPQSAAALVRWRVSTE